MNSEKMRSQTLETKTFEKFGFTFSYGLVTEQHKLWKQVYRDADNMVWAEEDLAKLAKSGQAPRVTMNYEDSGELSTTAYVEYARITDPSEGVSNLPIEIWGTIEGPLMGIVSSAFSDTEGVLVDPCVIIYDGKSHINLVPIFNVARKLVVRMDAVRTRQPPAEILLAMYPGFIIQNRMASYQLKPKMALVTSPELVNDAELSRH